MSSDQQHVSKIYHRRFARTMAYRNKVWAVLTREFFSRWVAPDACVLDLGCGYGEFINNIRAGGKLAMDLNPDSRPHLGSGVRFFQQDCSQPWPQRSGRGGEAHE